MNIDDLASMLKDKGIVIGTLNINAGNGEFYAAPVQVNQAAEQTPTLEPERYCELCGFSGGDIEAYRGKYTHALCRLRAEREEAAWQRKQLYADEQERQAARRKQEAQRAAQEWQVVQSAPEPEPEPEMAPEPLGPHEPNLLETLEQRYADAYAELVENGRQAGQKRIDFMEQINREAGHRGTGE
jgi:hypothetical protein